MWTRYIGYVAAGLLFPCLVGCATAKSDFARARRLDSVQAYDQFLQRYPTSEFSRTASERRKELLRLQAERARKQKEEAYLTAAEAGDTREVQDWIARGGSIDLRNKADETALMLAAHRGHLEVVKILLDHGADVNARQQNGSTALTDIVSHACSMASMLMGYGMEEQRLVLLVRVLVDAGADVQSALPYVDRKLQISINNGPVQEDFILPEDVRQILLSASVRARERGKPR